jgi:16S rRNA (uracil1498-N3)-methyltransferase
MRAVYLNNTFEEQVLIDGDKFHHFKNVLRLKVDTTILALSGNGESREYIVSQIDKKSLIIKSTSPIQTHKRKHQINLAIACVKKEALDLSVRMATELGYNSITILETEHSQNYKINIDRINTIIESSMEQSNSSFRPLLKFDTFDNFIKENKKIIYLSMKNTNHKTVDNFENYSILIGPEAGFTTEEDQLVCQNIETVSINLNTNILRAQTAVAAGLGYVLNMQNNIDA